MSSDKLVEVFDGPDGSKFECFNAMLGDPIAHDPAWICAWTDIKNDRFRDLEILHGPGGRIADRVTVRAAMERETWERLSQAAYMRCTSAAEIIRVLVADWLEEVKA